MKRSFDTVSVAARGDGFGVVLDDRALDTPAGTALVLPARALAAAIAEEWWARADDASMRPDSMPLMRLAATAVDRVAPRREAVIDEVAGYAESDLLCHRAEHPAELVARQRAAWDPLLDWARERHGVALCVTTGVLPVAQPDTALAACRAAVAAGDDFTLAAVHAITAAAGSVIVALALVAGRLDAEAAWQVSQIDESFQIARWGADPESTQRRALLATDIAAAERFLTLLRA